MSALFTGNRKRLWWAMCRADWPMEKRGVWLNMALSVEDARTLATAAQVSLAALYLPDPTLWEGVKAWWYGKTRKRLAGCPPPGRAMNDYDQVAALNASGYKGATLSEVASSLLTEVSETQDALRAARGSPERSPAEDCGWEVRDGCDERLVTHDQPRDSPHG